MGTKEHNNQQSEWQASSQHDEQLEELLALEAEPFDARRAQRIKQQTFSKLGISTQSKVRRLPRRLSVALVAAAIMIVAVPSAFAVSGIIANMSKGDIGFFGEAGRPIFFASMQADLENANAPVGQTLNFDGGTITLETLAVDDNFVSAFFTIRYDEPYAWRIPDEDMSSRFGGDDRFLSFATPPISCMVDGEEITAQTNVSGGGDSEREVYRVDERTTAMMTRQVINRELPDVVDLTIALPFGVPIYDSGPGGTYAEVEGTFAVTVDKSVPAALTRNVEPGTYCFETAEGSRELIIEKFSFSAFGVVAAFRAENFEDVDTFLITDDKGNTANPLWRGGVFGWKTDPQYDGTAQLYVCELVGLDPQAQSVTITPIRGLHGGTSSSDRVIVDLAQPGAEVTYSDLGGLTLVSREVQGSDVTTVFKPHGYIGGPSLVDGMGGLVLETDGLPLNENNSLGSVTSWYDRANNLVVLYEHFYAATEEDLAQATTYSYACYNSLTLDENATLTLPLS